MYRFPFIRLITAVLLLSCMLSLAGCKEKENISLGKPAPQVLTPEASNEQTLGGEPLLLDISHTGDGYLMALYTGDAAKANVQITGADGTTYKYFIENTGEYTVFPLTGGDGSYLICAYENIVDDQYANLFTETIDVTLSNEFLPFLYPNQFVDFSPDSLAVKKAWELAEDSQTDLDALTLVYEFVIHNFTYDDEKAASVAAGYLPDLDEIYRLKTGICFDYASLMTAMLRSLGIPCKMEIGYSGEVKHAWIDVYIVSQGWIEHAIEFDGEEWHLMDPTFASADPSPEMAEYIGDGSNYVLQYSR